ncbi:ABC transporter permease [Altericroceibacterium endophyticum]|uniref:FtsX-like permease family protein n=1 Tax=Altericroceibacterium endophyticum TaxID=1808508 RepID=A0A6I4T862_9SPHN|nr:ABC transporter permease [Altericroceibacterium endophyticum]MXO66203.1 FtsX-like permease family protein [Altericroceibacterium endophyticum]
MIGLVKAYLLERKLTTALNVLLLAISVAMLTLLLQFARQSEERFLEGAEGIDLVIGAKGSPLQLVLSSVYHLDQPTGNIPLSALERLRHNPLVASAIPLALGDQFAGFRIVGTKSELFDLYSAKLQSGKTFEAPLEAVIGSAVAEETGAGLGQRFIGSHGLAENAEGQGHEHTPFIVVGILEPTGKPIDRLILTSVESVWDVHGIQHDHGTAEDDHDGHEDAAEAHHADADHGSHGAYGVHGPREPMVPEITAILLNYRSPAAAVRLPSTINRNTALQAASPAQESSRLILLFEPAIEALGGFAVLLAATGALAIFVALWSAMRSREGDLALLRVMGASRAAIFGTVLLEGVMTALVAAALGILAAHGLLWLASETLHSVGEAGIGPGHLLPEEIAILAGAAALGALAAVIPAWTVMRNNLAPILGRN